MKAHPFTLALALLPLLTPACALGPEARFDEVPLAAVLEEAIAEGVFPGAVIEVGDANGVRYRGAFGRFTYEEGSTPMAEDTLFDLASVSKVMSTTTLAMRLVDRGALGLDERVHDHVPGFEGGDRDAVTVRHLLTHTAGLPAWRRFYERLEGNEAVLAAICAEALESPPGSRYRYSDLGMILLAAILERVGGRPLDALFAAEVAAPLGLQETFYNPPRELWSRCAPTEQCAWRGRMIQGEVHDENAYAMGGVAGHAGLFSRASDLGVICRMLLCGGEHEGERYLAAETVATFTRRQDLPPGSSRALGWGTASDDEPSCGAKFSKRAFGHTGFTGTSVWCDPERGLYVVLLSNRVQPTRENQKIKRWRPRIHDAVIAAISETAPSS